MEYVTNIGLLPNDDDIRLLSLCYNDFFGEHRSVAMGTCSMFSRIAGIVAPLILTLAKIWTPLPLVIYGSVSVIAGLLTLILPETLGHKLPETIKESEHFGRYCKMLFTLTLIPSFSLSLSLSLSSCLRASFPPPILHLNSHSLFLPLPPTPNPAFYPKSSCPVAVPPPSSSTLPLAPSPVLIFQWQCKIV